MAHRRSASCSAPRAVIGREFLDRSVHDARALQNEFEVPVLGEIPRIHAVAGRGSGLGSRIRDQIRD